MLSVQKICATLLLCAAMPAAAQDVWPSPEVQQMYMHAREYMALGDLNDAAITLKHAISLAPGKMVLYRDLALVLYRSGKFGEAAQALSSIDEMHDADAECYRVLAASQAAQNELKNARATIKKGLAKYPGSGMLFNEQGRIYIQDKKLQDGLNAWLDGIQHDPAYADNYYDAASIYLNAADVTWGLLYGEVYVNLSDDTARAQIMRTKLYSGYKALFDNVSKNVLDEKKRQQKATANNFISAFHQVIDSLTPVVSDGITTESLTMVRARFIMQWYSGFRNSYPYTLFSYWDLLIRTGHFDIYNEWLFGNAESAVTFKAWSEFHEGDLPRFKEWKRMNKLQPVSTDFYDQRNMVKLSTENSVIEN